MKAWMGIFWILLWMGGCSNSTDESEITPYKLNRDEKAQLRSGDLVFRKGRGMVSNMINAMQETDYQVSHCGILVERKERLQVVSAVSSEISEHSGVHGVPLDTFVKNSVPQSLIALRLKGESLQAGKRWANQARRLAKKEVPFDYSFSLESDDELYCTELIYQVLNSNGIGDEVVEPAQTDSGKQYVGFEAFLGNDRFKPILNHQNASNE